MQCQKVKRIFRYRLPSKFFSLQKFAQYVLLLYFPFRDEKELLLGFSPIYQNNSKRKESTIIHKIFETNSSFH